MLPRDRVMCGVMCVLLRIWNQAQVCVSARKPCQYFLDADAAAVHHPCSYLIMHSTRTCPSSNGTPTVSDLLLHAHFACICTRVHARMPTLQVEELL